METLIHNRPTYNKLEGDTKLFSELRNRVNARVSIIKEDRDKIIRLKVFLLPILYFGSYFTGLFNGDKPWLYISCNIMMGISLVLIYLNLIHEAAHNNIFKKNKKLNKVVMYMFDLIGANSYIFEKRHIISHHAYPSVDGWDTDFEQSSALKIYPHGEPAKGIQKYQHYFVFFLYPLFLFNWLFIRDFRDFFDKKRIISKVHVKKIPGIEYVKLFFFKIFYFFYQLFVPIFIVGIAWKLVVSAWIIQILSGSIFALFVLLPVHALQVNKFPTVDSNLNLPNSWVRHQFEVTNDLSGANKFSRYVLGNYNYHVAHHLFPSYSYEYYDEITDEIRKFAKEKNLSYKTFPIFTALYKHYQLLKKNATSIGDVMEKTM